MKIEYMLRLNSLRDLADKWKQDGKAYKAVDNVMALPYNKYYAGI